MTLAAGQVLSFYEILAPIGAGAMGEVYRARDTRLDREVAIKVLPDELAEDEELLRRFEREAKMLASLNHPNITGIHGVHQEGDVCFLSLELVPGEDLAQRLSRGALSIEEALDVCRQIAQGLEAAHEAGVIHRDLKPANVRITPAGEVKVVDFGLAKPVDVREHGSSTDSVLSTEAGRVLGTPTYMAPEQARGRTIDRRVDLWALGCVLYECLSGRRAFDGEGLTDVLAAVIEREPDGSALPARTPPRVRELVERCLVKDPQRRQRDAGDVRLELERALQERAWTRPPDRAHGDGRGSRAPRLLVVLLAVLIGMTLLREVLTSDPAMPRKLRFSVAVPRLDRNIYPRISPDGRSIVYEGEISTTGGGPPLRALFRRDLDSFESVTIPGTEHPFTFSFSPDGTQLGVLVERPGRGGELVAIKVDLQGEAPTVRLGAWPQRHRRSGGIVWLTSGYLAAIADPGQLVLLPTAEGGVATVRPIQRTLEKSGSGIDVYRGTPDGRHVLGRAYYYEERGYVSAVVAVDIETAEEQVIFRDGGHGFLTADGTLLFSRADTLFRVPFDLERLEATGAAEPIADGLFAETSWRSPWFDVARDGTLIWLPGGIQGKRRHLTMLETTGELTPLWPERMQHEGMLVVADDASFLTTTMLSPRGERVEVWGSTLDHPSPRRILAAPGTDFSGGHTLPGGRELVYTRVSDEGQNGIFRAPLDDPERAELLLPIDETTWSVDVVDVMPDGEFLLIEAKEAGQVVYSLLPLTGEGPPDPQPLLRGSTDQIWPKFSPDGRWLVHLAEDVDRYRVVAQRIQADHTLGPRLAVPTPDGLQPYDFSWTRDPAADRLEVVLVHNDRRRIYTVALEEGKSDRFAAPRLRTTLEDGYVLDSTALADGRILLIVVDPEELETTRVEVVMGALEGE